jgi:EmrB/QacA subfamily drug resistance transporter
VSSIAPLAAPPTSNDDRRRHAPGWTLALASLGSFMVVLDALVVATALSTLRRDLGASIEDLAWTVDAYTTSFAVLLMAGAALGDRYGRRRVYAAGLGVFVAASAGCALAPTVGWLIAARTVQGAGAALVMPVGLAMISAAFAPAARGKAFGIFSGVTALGAVVGPVLGGAVTQGLGWPAIFWINVPLGLVAIPVVLRRTVETRGPARALDVRGLALGGTGVLALVWGLVRSSDASGVEVGATLSGGLALLLAFVALQRRTAAPVLPLRLFSSRAFTSGVAATFLLNASFIGTLFLTAQLFQVALGQDALHAGLSLLPWGIVPFAVGPWSGALAARFEPRTLIVTGLSMQAAGLAWLAAAATAGTAYVGLALPMSVVGAGFALAITVLTTSVMGSVGVADAGTASGVVSTARQLGGAAGVAVAAAVFAGSGSAVSAQSFVDGFGWAVGATALLALGGALVGLTFPRHDRREAAAQPTERGRQGTEAAEAHG